MIPDYTDEELLESIRQLLNDEALLAEFRKLCEEILAAMKCADTTIDQGSELQK